MRQILFAFAFAFAFKTPWTKDDVPRQVRYALPESARVQVGARAPTYHKVVTSRKATSGMGEVRTLGEWAEAPGVRGAREEQGGKGFQPRLHLPPRGRRKQAHPRPNGRATKPLHQWSTRTPASTNRHTPSALMAHTPFGEGRCPHPRGPTGS